MPLLSTIGAAAARAFGFLRALISGYNVANSLRFNEASDDKLTKSIAGVNTTQLTISFWTKRTSGTNPDNVVIFSSENNAGQYLFIDFGTPSLGVQIGGTSNRRITNRVFRDPSAWYHVVITFDSTQATASDRIKIYINGVQETSFSTSTTGMSQNSNLPTISSTLNYAIGDYSGISGLGYDGYLAEFYAIYGQALTPSSFGETNTLSGIWIPKAYIGTFGTNGFYLKFANSAALGTDSSGNGNNFTVNNLTSVDQSTDTPTNNFATLNPLFIATPSAPPTYTEGNLQFKNTYSSSEYGLATIIPDTGKWYFEIKIASTTQNSLYEYFGTGGSYIKTSGGIYPSGSTTVSNGDIFGFATDITNSLSVITRNGTQIYSGTGGGTFVVANFTNTIYQINFGNPPYSANSYTDGAGYGNFSYAVPSGFYALCTKNLANFG